MLLIGTLVHHDGDFVEVSVVLSDCFVSGEKKLGDVMCKVLAVPKCLHHGAMLMARF